jgi:gluconolactonase
VIQADGALKAKQRFYWLHNTDNYMHNDIQNMAVDNGGNLYVATPLGVQVCDQNGRVRAILSLPEGAVSALCFGGEKLDMLYVACSGKLYKRKLQVAGVPAWAVPVAVPSQGAG